MRIADSFEFSVSDKTGRVVHGIGTIYDIQILPATRQVMITFCYEESGQTQQLTVDLQRFLQIVVKRQQTL